MGALEQIMEMKNQGVPENEILNKLSQNGISPGEINEAMNQARIKSAVSSEEAGAKEEGGGSEGMEASMMAPEAQGEEGGESLPTEHISDEDLTPPKPHGQSKQYMTNSSATQEIDEPQDTQERGQKEYTPQYNSAPQYQEYSEENPKEGYPQNYGGYENYQPQSVSNADTMIEIAEQVFFEKIKSIQKQTEDFLEFKTLTQVKVDNFSERLKRIESHMDRLQAEILEKVGSYGRGVDSIKKEMTMMQESFGKVVNNLVDKSEHKHQTHSTHRTSEAHPSKHTSNQTTNHPHQTTHPHKIAPPRTMPHKKRKTTKKKTKKTKTKKK